MTMWHLVPVLFAVKELQRKLFYYAVETYTEAMTNYDRAIGNKVKVLSVWIFSFAGSLGSLVASHH